jgi:hypothetical protein
MQLTDRIEDGVWVELNAGWNGYSFMDQGKRTTFAWHVGASGGRTLYAAEAPWLVEAAAGLSLGRRLGNFEFAAGTDFRYPLLSGGRAYWTQPMMALNPQNRVDLYARADLYLSTGWKVSGVALFADRGQVANPETILPVLEGGYDRTTFAVAFTYRGRNGTAR